MRCGSCCGRQTDTWSKPWRWGSSKHLSSTYRTEVGASSGQPEVLHSRSSLQHPRANLPDSTRRNQPAFDSLLYIPAGKAAQFPQDTLLAFQCTVSQSHTIHWSTVASLHKQFSPQPQRVCVVYVVPHDVYPQYTCAGTQPPQSACIEEWVLCVQLRPPSGGGADAAAPQNVQSCA